MPDTAVTRNVFGAFHRHRIPILVAVKCMAVAAPLVRQPSVVIILCLPKMHIGKHVIAGTPRRSNARIVSSLSDCTSDNAPMEESGANLVGAGWPRNGCAHVAHGHRIVQKNPRLASATT